MRARVFEILEGDWELEPIGRFINLFLMLLISANVAMVILGSVDSVGSRFQAAFYRFNLLSVAIFSVEYVTRLWVCVESPRSSFHHPIKGRLRYAITPMALIDFMAIAPFFAAFIMPTVDLRFLRVFRVFRLLKLSRYFPALHTIGDVVYEQRRALVSAFFVMVVMLIFSSSLMYTIEKQAQPDSFSSIPAAMWWGMATLTTVGYGDVTPITPLGKLAGTFIAMFGIGMFALPAAILASGFTREMERHGFIVSWKAVAKLPLLEGLTANEIGEIASLLRVRTTAPGEVVFRTGDQASGMFFVQSGQVRIHISNNDHHLSKGDFFGEIALLHDRERMGTANSETSCRLFVLDRNDFVALCERNPNIHQHVHKVAAERLKDDHSS